MKWWIGLLAAGIAATLISTLVCPGETRQHLEFQRDSARVSRDSAWRMADSLAKVASESQRVTDLLKAINHTADTVLITRIKYLAPKVAHADSVAPLDTLWRPIAFAAISQRDSALSGWHHANDIIARDDTTIQNQRQALWHADLYHDRSEKRISQLEAQVSHREFKLFGVLPLPKFQITYGTDPSNGFRLRPVAGLGYTLKFGRTHRNAAD